MEAQENQKGIYKLGLAMSRKLRKELGGWGIIQYRKGILLLRLSAKKIEKELGRLLQEIHQIIDRHFPQRQEDIPLLIVDDLDRYRLKLKIWHTANVN